MASLLEGHNSHFKRIFLFSGKKLAASYLDSFLLIKLAVFCMTPFTGSSRKDISAGRSGAACGWVGRGLFGEGHRELWGDGNVPDFDCGSDFVSLYIYQNSLNLK